MKNSIKYIGAIVLLLSFAFGTSSVIAQKVSSNPNLYESYTIKGDDVKSLKRQMLSLKKKVVETTAAYNAVKDGADEMAIGAAKKAMLYAEKKLNHCKELMKSQDRSTLSLDFDGGFSSYESYVSFMKSDSKEDFEQSSIIDIREPEMITNINMMSEEDILIEVKAVIESTGASGHQDMYKCMLVLTKKLGGKADSKIISSLVRSELVKN